jgi:hypothetical protein
MYYEVNISQNGKHFLATAKRSLSDLVKAKTVFGTLCDRFPAEEGYELSLTLQYETGEEIAKRTKDGKMKEVERS